jgi:hypothetical protein
MMNESPGGTSVNVLSGFSRELPPSGVLFRIGLEDLNIDARNGPRPAAAFSAAIAGRLCGDNGAPRFAIAYNAVPEFLAMGKSFQESVEWVRILQRELCASVFSLLCLSAARTLNPLGIDLEPIEFDLDGYHVNKRFMGDDIDFRSNKQAHFDIVEPLGSNLYGPNVNIDGGLPVFCDARSYCQAHGISITGILDKIPGTRNLTLEPAHYRALLEDYTVAYNLDMTHDTPFTIFVNRVEEAGLMHGATTVAKHDPGRGAQRPIRHYAWDNTTAGAAGEWYGRLGQSNERTAGDSAGHKPLIPPSLQLERGPVVIQVPAD